MGVETDAMEEECWFVVLLCVLCNDGSMLGGERKRDDDECVEGKRTGTGEEGVKGLVESVILLSMAHPSFLPRSHNVLARLD